MHLSNSQISQSLVTILYPLNVVDIRQRTDCFKGKEEVFGFHRHPIGGQGAIRGGGGGIGVGCYYLYPNAIATGGVYFGYTREVSIGSVIYPASGSHPIAMDICV